MCVYNIFFLGEDDDDRYHITIIIRRTPDPVCTPADDICTSNVTGAATFVWKRGTPSESSALSFGKNGKKTK